MLGEAHGKREGRAIQDCLPKTNQKRTLEKLSRSFARLIVRLSCNSSQIIRVSFISINDAITPPLQ